MPKKRKARGGKSAPAILIVDDDSCIRDMLDATLSANDYTVSQADGAGAAIEIFRRQRIDVVLSDVKMPVQMGPELLCELQAIDTHVRFCFMTGGDLGDYTMQELMASGAHAVLLKPFSTAALLECLNEILWERDGVTEISRQDEPRSLIG